MILGLENNTSELVTKQPFSGCYIVTNAYEGDYEHFTSTGEDNDE